MQISPQALRPNSRLGAHPFVEKQDILGTYPALKLTCYHQPRVTGAANHFLSQASQASKGAFFGSSTRYRVTIEIPIAR
jgi:hypothetical protein